MKTTAHVKSFEPRPRVSRKRLTVRSCLARWDRAKVRHNIPREVEYNGTTIINAYERYVFEIPDREFPLKDYGQVIYKTPYRPDYLEEDL